MVQIARYGTKISILHGPRTSGPCGAGDRAGYRRNSGSSSIRLREANTERLLSLEQEIEDVPGGERVRIAWARSQHATSLLGR